MKDLVKRVIYTFFSVFPIKKNKIICNNFYSKGYGDNPKYIVNELLKHKEKYEIYWICQSKYNDTLPNGVIPVNSAFKYLYHFATAKVWISNVRLPLYLSKRKRQYYIQTWHGALGFKKIEEDAMQSLSKNYIKSAKKDTKQIDLFISNSKFLSNIYRTAFWYKNNEILEVGIPRNDILKKNDIKLQKALKERLNVSGYNILLYAPTFRVVNSKKIYDIDPEKLVNLLEKITNSKWKILVKLHPNIDNPDEYFNFSDNVVNVSYYSDINELFFITDILITDYSSCAFDYMTLNKPVFIYANDLESYIKERDFYINFKEVPFPIALNKKELAKNIENNINKDFSSLYKDFIKHYGVNETGNSSKEIVKIIDKVIGD